MSQLNLGATLSYSSEVIFDKEPVIGQTISTAIDVSGKVIGDATAKVVDATPRPADFTGFDVVDGQGLITVMAHGFTTGMKVRFTSTGDLPATVLADTDYFLIARSHNTLSIALTLANAMAGNGMAFPAAGTTGTGTITPQALRGTIKLQKSSDLITSPTPVWVDILASTYPYPGIAPSGVATPDLLNWVFANNLSGSFGEIGFLQLRAIATTESGVAVISLRLATKGRGDAAMQVGSGA